MTTQGRGVFVVVRGGDPSLPQSHIMFNYEECVDCGAMLIGASPMHMHHKWHEENNADTETYKKVLDEAKELVDELKGLRARMPRML
jgi:hypothetical protein